MRMTPFDICLLSSDLRICHMSVSAQSKLKNFLICWLPLIIYCLAIYIQSSLPGLKHIPEVRFMDKMLHFGAYGLLGVLFFRAYRTLLLKDSKNLLILISIGSAILYGISDEIHQYFVPFREADIMDVVANTIGSICGVYFYHLWRVQKKSA
jgi:VanZ family protein